jgi:hypothetical protein
MALFALGVRCVYGVAESVEQRAISEYCGFRISEFADPLISDL